MQCYNNNSDDCSNLIGETRIPLIFAIENGNLKKKINLPYILIIIN